MPQQQDANAQLDPSPQPRQAPIPARSASRLLPVLGVVMGLLGLAMGAAAWFRAGQADSAAQPVYSEQEVAEATKAVCEAYAKGIRSIRVVAGTAVDNPADALPIAVNSRLAEVAVGNYFINALSENTAAPNELREALSDLSQAYQDVALIQLADGMPVDYKSEKEVVNEAVEKLDQICQ